MSSVRSQILEETVEQVDRLHSMWVDMFEPKTCEEFLHKLKDHVHNFYNDLLAESTEKQQFILDEIASLRSEADELKRLLHQEVVMGEKPDDMPLLIWQLKLDKSIEHLREELRQRRAEICELLLQQEQLCDELGELPLPLLADPLPKPLEMETFRDHLAQLRAQRDARLKELFELRQQIKQDMKLLEISVHTDAERDLLNQANNNLTPETLEKLKEMQICYAEQVQELVQRIDEMREKIRVLWERLEEEVDDFAKRRVNESTKYNQRTYDILREELQRCQALRRQNLKRFIEQLRLEIKEWWDLTLKSDQERKRFSNYYNEWYNEDLLELHELELDDLKTFYNNNKEIFELYASRMELWARMEALEAKASEPGRFNNRGGQLLKEERERKAITSKLPKIEQQITELVQAYEQRVNGPFLVHGENILERLAGDWERKRASKQQNSARKKGGMMPPPTPGTTAPRTPMSLRNMSAMSSSTMSLRKIPSQPQLVTAHSTGNHKRRHPTATSGQSGHLTPHAKRSLMSSLNSIKASPTARRQPVQRLLADRSGHSKSGKSPLKRVRVLDSTLRRSGGLGRRSLGKSRPKVTVQVQPPTDDEYTTDENAGTAPGDADHEDTYQEFAPAARSSVLPRTLRKPRALNTPRKRPNIVSNNNNHLEHTLKQNQEPTLNQVDSRTPC